MKYDELPTWAKRLVRKTVTKWYVENGEDKYGTDHLNQCVQEYINDHDSFTVEYDEETGKAIDVYW